MALEAFMAAFPEMAGIGSSSDEDEDAVPQKPYYDGNETLEAVMMSDSNRKGEKAGFGLDRIKHWIDRLHYESILENIGKFDKWKELPEKAKRTVVSHLHLYDRYSLMYCSKSDYQLVQSVPVILTSLEIADEELDCHTKIVGITEKNIGIKLWSEKPGEEMHIVFVKDRNKNSKLYRFFKNKDQKSYSVKWMEMRNRSYMDEAVKFIEKILKRAGYRVDEFTLSAKGLAINPSIYDKLKVRKELIVVADSRKSLTRFLDTAGPQPLDYLEVGFRDDIRSSNVDHFNHDVIINAKKFILVTSSGFAINDQQFLNLKCEEITLMVHTISDVAINTFVKRWVNGGGPANFKLATAYCDNRNDRSKVLSGLEYFRWDKTFREQNVTLSGYVDEKFPGMVYYYIENKKKTMGATLAIGPVQFALIITGKRRNRVMDEKEMMEARKAARSH